MKEEENYPDILTVEEFISHLRKKIVKFRRVSQERIKKSKAIWPDKMFLGDWEEEFYVFDLEDTY